MILILSALALPLIISGEIQLVGGKRIKSKKIRIIGILLSLLIIGIDFFPKKISIPIYIIIVFIYISLYFQLKTEEDPSKEKLKMYGFKSIDEEKRTYIEALKGIFSFLIVIALFAFGVLFVIRAFV
jgi:hypothetical protein